MLRPNYILIVATVVTCMAFGASGSSKLWPLSNGKVLLHVSLDEKERLFKRLGLTNILSSGSVDRDSQGTRIFTRVEIGIRYDQVQRLRTQRLVVVTAEGVHTRP